VGKTISPKRLREVLSYDPETGGFYWIQRTSNCTKIGRIAGSVIGGYRYISIDGQRFKAAVLAWVYMKGRMPRRLVDHISTEKLDDRICNLRLANYSQNSANIPAHFDNACGFKGVYRHSSGKFRARVMANGFNHHVGMFDTPEEASAAYYAAAKKLHGAFARAGV